MVSNDVDIVMPPSVDVRVGVGAIYLIVCLPVADDNDDTDAHRSSNKNKKLKIKY